MIAMMNPTDKLRVVTAVLLALCIAIIGVFALLVLDSNGKTKIHAETAMAIEPAMSASDMVEPTHIVKQAEPMKTEPEAAAVPVEDTAYAEVYGDYDGSYGYGDGAYAWDPSYGASDFRGLGRVSDNGRVYTWYSENVLPGGGLDQLNANGRHVNDDGYVVDCDGYIAVATPGSSDEIGNVVDTPFGPGRVYDTNPGGDSYDIYTSW